MQLTQKVFCVWYDSQTLYLKQPKTWLCSEPQFCKETYFAIIMLAEGFCTELLVQNSYHIFPTSNILKDADYFTSAQGTIIFLMAEPFIKQDYSLSSTPRTSSFVIRSCPFCALFIYCLCQKKAYKSTESGIWTFKM